MSPVEESVTPVPAKPAEAPAAKDPHAATYEQKGKATYAGDEGKK